MCVLLISFQEDPAHPLVLGATRDEAYARPWEPPALREADRPVLCPTDLQAGGTWIGLTGTGLVAAITNRPGSPAPPPTRPPRSRGLLVADVLAQPGVAAARAFLADHLAATGYEPFNLVVADRTTGFRVRGGDGAARIESLTPGFHTLSNFHDWDAITLPPARRPAAGGDAPARDRWRTWLADHRFPLPGDRRICKHGDRYGTVSAAWISLNRGPGGQFWFAAGPPCTHPLREYAPLLDASAPRAGRALC